MRKLLIPLFVLMTGVAFAQKPGVNKPPAQKTPVTRILFVFDASQSMLARWESTQKMEVARKLMIEMLDSLAGLKSDQFQLALRVYGHQKPVPPQDCNDTRLEVSFSPGSIGRMKKFIQTVTPKGTTPIARSLELAATDFPPCADCRNVIILITDGVEACDGDPCAVSRALQKKGIILKPFVIGVGIDPNFKNTFQCVGNYYDAATEKSFKTVLGIVISQAMNNTSAQINLLDEKGKATETDVPMTLYDRVSGAIRYNLVHTMNAFGNPDTVYLDPLPTYDLVVHTKPPVRQDSVVVYPGKHNHIGVSTPQGSLELKIGAKTPVYAVIRQRGQGQTLNVQTMNTTERYLTGRYDVEILTLPRYVETNVEIKQSHTTTLAVPPPGRIQFTSTSPGYGSIFVVRQNTLEWVVDLDQTSTRHSFDLQPGQYTVIFRPKNSRSTQYTVSHNFSITSGGSTVLKLN
jgi:Ca-activated chloride channel family protein